MLHQALLNAYTLLRDHPYWLFIVLVAIADVWLIYACLKQSAVNKKPRKELERLSLVDIGRCHLQQESLSAEILIKKMEIFLQEYTAVEYGMQDIEIDEELLAEKEINYSDDRHIVDALPFE